MAETISVVIGTFGDRTVWEPLAQRAAASALNQTSECEVLLQHGATLAEARNRVASLAEGDWLIFLDADDELDPNYIAAMQAALDRVPGFGMFQPSTLGIVDGVADPTPVLIQPRGRTLLDGNHLVIGTMVPRSEFHVVGGFRELLAWEDWDLFIRLWLRGLRDEPVLDAIYRVHVKSGSRNDLPTTGVGRQQALRLYHQIRSMYLDEARRKGLI